MFDFQVRFATAHRPLATTTAVRRVPSSSWRLVQQIYTEYVCHRSSAIESIAEHEHFGKPRKLSGLVGSTVSIPSLAIDSSIPQPRRIISQRWNTERYSDQFCLPDPLRSYP